MPVPSELVGRRTQPVTHTVDARWLMAYAAGVGDADADELDTRRPGGIEAHPLFPVCVEWPAVLAVRHLAGGALGRDELVRGVHATHDLVLHRPIRPGDELTTVAEVVGVERRRPGALQVVRLRTVDATGAPVATTDMGTLFLGVDVSGDDRPAPPLPGPGRDDGDGDGDGDGDERTLPVAATVEVPLAATAAHVYTECSRIWNPIHTDAAVAAAAGLPGTILHGTATLAVAVSAARRHAGAEPAAARRIRGRFGAMVALPDTVTVELGPVAATADGLRRVPFAVRTGGGAPAVTDGELLLAAR